MSVIPTDIIPDIIEKFGYLGVFLLMLFEAVFPPVPSEIIMPLAGAVAAKHSLTLWGVILSGTLGALLGAVFWFGIAWALGLDRFENFLLRYGRIFTLDERTIRHGRVLFEKYGGVIVGVGRLIPGVRSVISVPAGLVRMRTSTFILYSFAGYLLAVIGLTVAGYLLGARFPVVHQAMGPVSTAILAICLIVYFYRVLMWGKWQRARGRI